MKKAIALLLTLAMTLPLASCRLKDSTLTPPPTTGDTEETTTAPATDGDKKEPTTETPNTPTTPSTPDPVLGEYDKIIDLYKKGINICPNYINAKEGDVTYAEQLGITDESEKALFYKLLTSAHLFYPGIGRDDKALPYHKRSCGYAVKDLNGDGSDELILLIDYIVVAIFSLVDGTPVLLGNYIPRSSCWIDDNGWLHENRSGGASYFCNSVYKIAADGATLERIVEYGADGDEWVDDVIVTKYYQWVNGEKKPITEAEYLALDEQYGRYLGPLGGAVETKKNLEPLFTPLFTEDEIAVQTYEAAIHDEISVFDERLGETNLKNLRFASNDTSLAECKLLKKAILDVDQDGIREYVIQSTNQEYIILRCYHDKVYSYYLDICDYYKFNTDGTFYWCHSPRTKGRESGLSKIAFTGEALNIKSIYSLKYSDYPNVYFVEGKAVTSDEYYDCRMHHRFKDSMRFSPFELTCSYPITAEQAWDLANTYWDKQDGCGEQSAGTIWTARIVLIDTPNSGTDYYRIAFQVEWNSGGGLEGYECMPPFDIRLHDQILVNAFTGEITTPACESGNKAISVEEAIEIVKKHDETRTEENGHRFEHDVNSPAPDHIYAIVTQKYDNGRWSFITRTWVDKYTGEIVFSYYLHGK